LCFRRTWRYSFSDFTALNAIDASALECLETINKRLRDAVVTFHLPEVQGPAMDRLQNSGLLDHLSGPVLLGTIRQ
jgi:SulP family sulfate permease